MKLIYVIIALVLFALGCKGDSENDIVFGEVEHHLNHRQIEVTWNNDSVTLSGTLYLPIEEGVYPLAIWVHGSSANLRLPYRYNMHELFRHCSALTWVERGYAFFSYDKRGSGESSGGFKGKDLTHEEIVELLASDAASAVDVCVNYNEVNPNFVGFFGGSQAGITIPIAALQQNNLAFAIIINGPVAPYWAIDYFGELTGNNSSDFYFTNCENPNLDSIYSILDSVMLEYPQYDTAINAKVDLIQMKTPACHIQGLQDLNQPARHSLSELIKIDRQYDKSWKIIAYEEADHALTTNGALCVLKQKKPIDSLMHVSVNWETPVFHWLDSLMTISAK